MSRNGETSKSGAKTTNRDAKFASHKQTLQHTVRAKKINESHLFSLLRSVDDQKNRRNIQIDKEVVEVEKFLEKLNKDQDEIKRLKMIRRNTQSALSNSLPETSTSPPAKTDRSFGNVNDTQKRERKETPVATKLIDSYYKFDANGKRIADIQLNSLSSPLAGFKESKVAWEYITDDWSMSGLSLKDFRRDSAKSSRHSDTQTANTIDEVSDHGGDTCISPLDVPIKQFEDSQRARNHLPSNSTPRKGQHTVGMGGRKAFNSHLKSKDLSSENREIESGRKSSLRRGDKNGSGLRREVTFNETPDIHFPHVRRKTFPGDMTKNLSSDSSLSPNDCKYPDCIYHNREHLLSTHNKELSSQEYCKTLPRVGEITGKMVRIIGKNKGTSPSEWKSKRVAIPLSPTPSDVFRGVDTSVRNRNDLDFTDLNVMSSVRRPTKGSNREMMLRTKEVNLITTFALMRKRVADRIPQDFNRNYGNPTPNWKILNPLKLRHKITHSSPLFVKWKF